MEPIHPLKAFRERHSPPLTQEQLASRLGVSKASVSRWEAGERKLEIELLRFVSTKTGIPAAQLRPDIARMFAPSQSRKTAKRAPANAT